MFLFIPFYLLFILLTFLNKYYIKCNELYIPYSDYKNPSINSIHGTGNRTLDKLYRENCAKLCGEKTYSDIHCCEGNTIEEEKCQSFKRCQEILDNFQRYVIGIALSSYLILMVITMIIVSIVYYCFTKDKYYKCKNAYSSAIIILFTATLLPIAILQFYCWYKVITIEQFFGAKFDKCFNIGESFQSANVKEGPRHNAIINENNENDEKNFYGDCFQKEKPIKITNREEINPQKSSQRSGNIILEEENND